MNTKVTPPMVTKRQRREPDLVFNKRVWWFPRKLKTLQGLDKKAGVNYKS